ncbi:hypothetical protein OROHE_003987 [Orobanche hederae]
MMFSNLKSIAEKNLNVTVVDCCIGIPVYFTDLQRRAILDAATIAGLHPLRLFHATTATALAYGSYKTDLPENEALKVFASLSLGGRDFDEALFQYFATKFKDDEYKIDVYQNARACLKLRAACQNLKKVLSANPEASLNIECLMEEKDVRVSITRDEFENSSIQILERVKKPLEKALSESGLTIKDVHLVKVVGSGSRVPAIIKILTEFFRKEPSQTMNSSECVSKGCALQCAILSPTFTLQEFQVNESFPFPIALTWRVFLSAKEVTFPKSRTSTVDVQYANVSESQAPAKISSYMLEVRLNLHGIVSVESATVNESFPFPIALTWRVFLSAKEVTFPKSRTSTVDVQYADVSESQAPAKISSYMLEVRLNLHGIVSVESATCGGFAAADLQKAVKKELEMALQDRVMDETKDKKNEVEAYVYDMRNKLTKLEELKKLGDPIEERYKEHSGRGSVDQLVYCISIYREAATSSDPKNDHIDRDERQKVFNECVETEAWLREKKQHQDALPKHATPALLSADVKKKAEALDSISQADLLNKQYLCQYKVLPKGDEKFISIFGDIESLIINTEKWLHEHVGNSDYYTSLFGGKMKALSVLYEWQTVIAYSIESSVNSSLEPRDLKCFELALMEDSYEEDLWNP